MSGGVVILAARRMFRISVISVFLDWQSMAWCGMAWHGMARYSAGFLFHNNANIDPLKLNLLPNRVIENFWDALWLGVRPFSVS